jgi:hypothetical protein
MIDASKLALPILRLLSPETAHRATINGLRLGLGGHDRTPDDPILAIRRFGLDFTNPLGLAAGFDKNAEVVRAQAWLRFRRIRYCHATAATGKSQAADIPPAGPACGDQSSGFQQCGA